MTWSVFIVKTFMCKLKSEDSLKTDGCANLLLQDKTRLVKNGFKD